MHYKEYKGINNFLVEMSKTLLHEGVPRSTRGMTCFEIPNPITIKIKNPSSRIITIEERKWNYTLPFVESLWLASGRNDMAMVGHYVRKLHDFSDDHETMRAGYGPRMRFYNGISEDYNTGFCQKHVDNPKKETIEVDQFEFIEKIFRKDVNTRQGIITISDPAKDCFVDSHELKETKDFPCTKNLQFIRNSGKLDLIVNMRSNDFVWGATGVNVFNFTFIQEYFSRILGLPIGNFYLTIGNFHYYEKFKSDLEKWAAITSYSDDGYYYEPQFISLSEFDEKIRLLQIYERGLREQKNDALIDFGDDFFNDWAKIFYHFHYNSRKVKFDNPMLNLVTRKRMNAKTIKSYRDQYDGTFPANPDDKPYWRNNI